MEQRKISAIALCWNHLEDVTIPFVNSFLKNTRYKNWELILCDNGSTDGTKEYLKSLSDPRIKIVFSRSNRGYGEGNNGCFLESSGRVLVFLNNDVVFHDSSWMDKINKLVESGTVIGQQLVIDNGATEFLGGPTPYLNGWCVAVERTDLERILEEGKVFDPRFGLAYFEDVDLSHRLSSAGCNLVQVDLGIEHLGSKSSDQLNKDEAFKKAQMHFINKMTYTHLEKTGKKRYVFFAGGRNYGFIDSDYEGKGVGGAEASIILLCRELAKKGHWVDLYNNTAVTGRFNGVNYLNVSQYNPSQYADLFVLFRNYHPVVGHTNSRHTVFWSCDQETDSRTVWTSGVFPNVEKTICISDYHKKYIQVVYNQPENKTKTIDLGINAPDYEVEVPKIPGKAIYCSVPQRGLVNLLKYIPRIKEEHPEFNLTITSDYRLWGLDNPNNSNEVAMFANLDYVTFLGKISRAELVKHQLESELMIYPCVYEECFCISAMECIAAGAIPVTTDIGAMKQTVGKSGVVIPGMPGDTNYDQDFLHSVGAILDRSELSEATFSLMRKHGRKRALSGYSWKKISEQWESLIDELDESDIIYEMTKCKFCERTFRNSYLSNRHANKFHPAENLDVAPDLVLDATQLPTKAVLRFRSPVGVGVNGHWYEGKEIEVEYEYVTAVLEQVRNSYGPGILSLE